MPFRRFGIAAAGAADGDAAAAGAGADIGAGVLAVGAAGSTVS
jgi:hypothetical protein